MLVAFSNALRQSHRFFLLYLRGWNCWLRALLGFAILSGATVLQGEISPGEMLEAVAEGIDLFDATYATKAKLTPSTQIVLQP